jgi:alpha-L-rhamnosidase
MFKTSTGGLIASDMQMGDIFDASLEPTGWQLGDFDDRNWHNVRIVSEHADANLISSRSVPVREKERLFRCFI